MQSWHLDQAVQFRHVAAFAPDLFCRYCGHMLLIRKFLLVLFVSGFCLSVDLSAQTSQTKTAQRNQKSTAPPAASGNLTHEPVEKTKTPKLKFKKHGGVVYRKSDTFEIKCDVYVPEGVGPYPAIIAIHGGAWRSGTKFTMLRHAWRMAGKGYVVVAINYRHAPEHPFPAQVHDCKHAVRWIRANSKTYKVDSAKIGAFGYSAGGHLVAMLGTTDVKDQLEGPIESGFEKFSSRVQAVAAGGVPCEFSWISENNPVLGYWLGGTRKLKPKVYKSASPLTYVTKDDPPFYLFHGDSDIVVPDSSSLLFHQALLKSGVSSQHFIANTSGHLATFSDMKWMDRAIEFFDSVLKNK